MQKALQLGVLVSGVLLALVWSRTTQNPVLHIRLMRFEVSLALWGRVCGGAGPAAGKGSSAP